MGIEIFKNKEFLLSYMVEIMRMSSKGQLVIPLRIRKELEIEEGSIIGIERINDVVLIKKVDQDLKDQFSKSLKDVKAGRIKRIA